jgi:hypothetical protein
LHDLRHSAAARMVRDPQLTLTDVQWVLGHAHLSTTQIYLTPARKRSWPACLPITPARPGGVTSLRRRRRRAMTRSR